jgi:glycosyltransferase A (GT-A) superfamily protein (DUF2064 family)
MPWSTALLLDRTLERAQQLGLRVHQLAAVNDLDTPDDLRRYLHRLNGGSGTRTARCVKQLNREIS